MNINPLKIIVITLFVGLLSQNVFSMAVSDAKAKGLAGEQSNGYVGIATPAPSQDLITLVAEVNKKRRQIYTQLANNQGVSLTNIEQIAGERNIKKTPTGQFIKEASGSWRRKKK